MLTEWAPVLTVTGVLAAAVIGLIGVIYSQRKNAEREREAWRRERVYDECSAVIDLANESIRQGEFGGAVLTKLASHYQRLESLVYDFDKYDERGVVDRYREYEEDEVRMGLLMEASNNVGLVIFDLHDNEWSFRRRRQRLMSKALAPAKRVWLRNQGRFRLRRRAAED